MSLYTKNDRLRQSSLSKRKPNLYFKEFIIVNNETCSLLSELIVTTRTLKFHF